MYHSNIGFYPRDAIAECLQRVGSLVRRPVSQDVFDGMAGVYFGGGALIRDSTDSDQKCYIIGETCNVQYVRGVRRCITMMFAVKEIRCSQKQNFFVCEFPGKCDGKKL